MQIQACVGVNSAPPPYISYQPQQQQAFDRFNCYLAWHSGQVTIPSVQYFFRNKIAGK